VWGVLGVAVLCVLDTQQGSGVFVRTQQLPTMAAEEKERALAALGKSPKGGAPGTPSPPAPDNTAGFPPLTP
jgi:hypothetical protein